MTATPGEPGWTNVAVKRAVTCDRPRATERMTRTTGVRPQPDLEASRVTEAPGLRTELETAEATSAQPVALFR
jgi:hypothetical protein